MSYRTLYLVFLTVEFNSSQGTNLDLKYADDVAFLSGNAQTVRRVLGRLAIEVGE